MPPTPKKNALSEIVGHLTKRHFHSRLTGPWGTGYDSRGLSDFSFSHHYAWTLGRRLRVGSGEFGITGTKVGNYQQFVFSWTLLLSCYVNIFLCTETKEGRNLQPLTLGHCVSAPLKTEDLRWKWSCDKPINHEGV